jgi:hypothetical protein
MYKRTFLFSLTLFSIIYTIILHLIMLVNTINHNMGITILILYEEYKLLFIGFIVLQIVLYLIYFYDIVCKNTAKEFVQVIWVICIILFGKLTMIVYCIDILRKHKRIGHFA